MPQRVVVIGGGIVGLSSAWALHQRGWKVTVVEARKPGYGASTVNAGWVCPAHADPVPAPGLVRTSMRWMLRSDSPLYIQPRPSLDMARWLYTFWRQCNEQAYHAGTDAMMTLASSAFSLLDEMRVQGIAFEEHRDGIIHVYESRARLESIYRDYECLTGAGVDLSEPIWGDDIRELEPSLSDRIVGGFWLREERSIRPITLIEGLTRYLRERGVDFRSGVQVRGFDWDRNRVTNVRFDRGRLEVDAALIAAGVWSAGLARLAKRRVPIQPGKGYSLDYTPSPIEILHPMHVDAGRHAVTPFDGITRLAGTMEFSGINDTIRPERVEAIIRSAARTFRKWPTDLRIPVIGAGMRPMSADGIPVIGWLPGYRNLAIATGHGMLGLTLGPSTGDAIAELMTTGTRPGVLEPFDPGRFGRI
jgi:D-amino-acid dehydrogenase